MAEICVAFYNTLEKDKSKSQLYSDGRSRVTTDSPVALFLNEELNSSVSLIKFVHKCFSSLKKAIKEVSEPAEDDLVIANSLMCQKV